MSQNNIIFQSSLESVFLREVFWNNFCWVDITYRAFYGLEDIIQIFKINIDVRLIVACILNLSVKKESFRRFAWKKHPWSERDNYFKNCIPFSNISETNKLLRNVTRNIVLRSLTNLEYFDQVFERTERDFQEIHDFLVIVCYPCFVHWRAEMVRIRG